MAEFGSRFYLFVQRNQLQRPTMSPRIQLSATFQAFAVWLTDKIQERPDLAPELYAFREALAQFRPVLMHGAEASDSHRAHDEKLTELFRSLSTMLKATESKPKPTGGQQRVRTYHFARKPKRDEDEYQR